MLIADKCNVNLSFWGRHGIYHIIIIFIIYFGGNFSIYPGFDWRNSSEILIGTEFLCKIWYWQQQGGREIRPWTPQYLFRSTGSFKIYSEQSYFCYLLYQFTLCLNNFTKLSRRGSVQEMLIELSEELWITWDILICMYFV